MKEKKIKIFLIEDDSILGGLILELFSLNNFAVTWFKSGLGVIDSISKDMPDIIVSDYMMPNINGEELFLSIRKNSHLRSIPFIMITANVEEGLKYRQLKSGVNDFITKPFKVKELVYKINNMMDLKRNLINQSAKDPFSKVTITLSQKDFITSLNSILVASLKTQMDIDDLCRQLFLSRSTLDRKIRTHTGKNISKYIREFKLDYAIKLMDSGEKNMQFIADEIGFNSFSYFSTSFKSYKNMTPTQYIISIRSEMSF